jgi:uncharacterized protein (DUF433 family)
MGIGSMIETTPEVCGGRPRIAGTRVAVHRVAGYYRLGYAPEEIPGLLGSLTLQQVYAALAHALANPSEIDAALRDEEDVASRLSAANRAA